MVEIPKRSHTIRTFALVCVAITSGWMIYVSYWLINLLATTGWCKFAVGAADDVQRPEFAVTGCYTLLKAQVAALTNGLYISQGTLAICLMVLMVIVIAGGKLSFRANVDGASMNIGSDEAPRTEAAHKVARAADEAADKIEAEEVSAPATPKKRETEIME